MRINPKISPFSWSDRTIKIVMASFFAIALPVYFIIGLQPSSDSSPAATATSNTQLPENDLKISSIGLSTPVEVLTVTEKTLEAPDKIAGSFSQNQNKTLLIGHSSTVFQNLKNINIDDEINYLGKIFIVKKLETIEKSEVKMPKLLEKTTENTIILMTCAGHHLSGQDYSHRLVVTAVEKR